MMRFVFIFGIFCFWLVSFAAFAKEVPQENFYIPEGAFDTRIILPPISIGNYSQTQTIKRAVPEAPKPQTSAQKPVPSGSLSTSTDKNSSAASAVQKLDAHAKPDYKEKYDEYLNDLKVIGETGKIPNNPELTDDLKNMNSNEKFEIE